MHQDDIKRKLLAFVSHKNNEEVKNFYKDNKRHTFNKGKRYAKLALKAVKIFVSLFVFLTLIYISFYIIFQ